MLDIEDKVKREKDAYNVGDVRRHSEKLHKVFEHVFLGTNSRYAEDTYRDTLEKAARNRVVMDYGCYEGEELMPMLLSLGPKKIVGIDVSEKAIEGARKRFGHQAEYRVMDAHKMDFDDNSFDVVAGKAILHHLDFEKAVREIQRVLKPGGVALFIEPLRDNPVGKLFRFFTPQSRTKDELPLSRKQILWADDVFGNSSHFFYNLFSIPSGVVSSFLFKNPHNFLTKLTHQLDMTVTKTLFKYWMRSVVLVWEKK